MILKPALAGDRNLPPAKAGLAHLGNRNPGFRSLRSLHPGLYSAAGYAGSLSLPPKNDLTVLNAYFKISAISDSDQ
jgi:hypothetical protein